MTERRVLYLCYFFSSIAKEMPEMQVKKILTRLANKMIVVIVVDFIFVYEHSMSNLH